MPRVSTVRSEASPPPATSAPSRRGWAQSSATVVSLAVSGAVLVGLYRSLDIRLVGAALRSADTGWLVISLGMIVPITLLRAIRFLWVAPIGALPGLGEALRLTLVSSALNTFVPAKAGDLIKGYFVATRGSASPGVAVAIVVYERLCDLFSLIVLCLVGWLATEQLATPVPPAVWSLLAAIGVGCAVLISSERSADLWRLFTARVLPRRELKKLRRVAAGWPDLLQLLRGRRRKIVLLSLVLWLVHLTQIWMFTLALSMAVPYMVCAYLLAVVLVAGQVPFTFAGLGARDVALVVLLANYATPETAAALGILIASRSLLPPLAALPIMRPYLAAVAREARGWGAKGESVE